MSDCSMHVQKREKQQRNQFPRGRVENGTFYSFLKGKLEGCLMGVLGWDLHCDKDAEK